LTLNQSVAAGLGDRRCQSGPGRCLEQPEEGGPVVTCKSCAEERFWQAPSEEKPIGAWQQQCQTCRGYRVPKVVKKKKS